MNDFLEENKKTILLIIILVAATIIISIASLFFGNKDKLPSPENAMKELAAIYYEDYYYSQLIVEREEDYKSILNNYSTKGLKVTLADLVSVIDSVEMEIFSNSKKNTLCDFYETYVLIYPNGNFKKEDYDVKVYTKCDIGISTEGETENE